MKLNTLIFSAFSLILMSASAFAQTDVSQIFSKNVGTFHGTTSEGSDCLLEVKTGSGYAGTYLVTVSTEGSLDSTWVLGQDNFSIQRRGDTFKLIYKRSAKGGGLGAWFGKDNGPSPKESIYITADQQGRIAYFTANKGDKSAVCKLSR